MLGSVLLEISPVLVSVTTHQLLLREVEAEAISDIGRSVLLLEGRDRIGGRSYTVEEDGTCTNARSFCLHCH